METISRIDAVKELAKLAQAIQQDGLTGFVIIAVHANEDATIMACAPETKGGVEKLMTAVDRMHFRMQANVYLGAQPVKPKDGLHS